MFSFIDGNKTYILGGLAIVLGALKAVSDFPEIEAITILNVSEPWDLITAGWAIVGARSAVKKIES